MARMAQHVPARELQLQVLSNSRKSRHGSSSSSSNSNSNSSHMRDLIDANTVKDSLNALPGFKTSAGESLLFPQSAILRFTLFCHRLAFSRKEEVEKVY